MMSVTAQQGSPLLTHFRESREIENQNWAICQDEDQVMLFANRKGISAFDGLSWRNIRIATIPYTMQKNPADNRIYIGGDGSYGYIEKDEADEYRYISLSSDLTGAGIITKIIFSDSLVWFYSDQLIIRYNPHAGKQDIQLRAKPGFPFTGMFVTSRNTFVNVMDNGLHRIESDTLFPIVTGYLTQKTDILFSLPYSETMVLTGRSDGTLALFDGIKYYDYTIRDDGYLIQNILFEGISLGDTAYAFSTLEGGVIIVQKNTGKVLYTINNQSELPDDEVYAIGSDISGGLWISHQYGLTRADLSLPMENYSIFPGLKGNLTSALRYSGELYVASSEGVFYLAEVKSFDEVEYFVKKTSYVPEVEKKVRSGSGTENEPEPEPEQQPKRKNIFSKIFGRKTDPQNPPPTTVKEEVTKNKNEKVAKRPVVRYTRKTVSKLKSINFVYNKVEGLNEKCRQLVATPYGILAATNKGLFCIRDHKSVPLIPGKYITYIRWQPYEGVYYIASNEGCYFIRNLNGEWISESLDPGFTDPIYSITRENKKTIWLGGQDSVYKADLDDSSAVRGYVNYTVSKEFPDRYVVRLVKDTVFLFTESEIHYYDKSYDKFEKYSFPEPLNDAVKDYLMPLSNIPLLKMNDDWVCLGEEGTVEELELTLLKLFDDVVFAGVEDLNIWVIDNKNRLFRIDRNRSSKINPELIVLIKRIKDDRDISFSLKDVKFDRGDNVIHFKIIAPGYLKEKTTRYRYLIYGVMKDWSEWSTETEYKEVIDKPGHYTLQVMAKDIWGNTSERKRVEFTIRAPFTKTLVFYTLLTLAGLSLIIFIILFREKQLQQTNKILEEKVRERTAELAAQKQEITASIEYAGRIQLAMLPMEDHFRESFTDYFIYFKPRDIVSGDFYWIGEDDKSIFFTVADCTGHGVPGAFMSTMGISTLNEIIANNRNLQADTVLNLLRDKTMRALHQTGKIGEAADGMDVAFCVLNKNRKILQFAGAFNPLIIFQGGELLEFRADRMPIGIHYGGEKPFTNHVLTVNRGDTLYIFSDGYVDQFGGPDGVKFKMANFRNLLKEIYYHPMIEQRNILENEFEKWKGSGPQVDDITIIGIRI